MSPIPIREIFYFLSFLTSNVLILESLNVKDGRFTYTTTCLKVGINKSSFIMFI